MHPARFTLAIPLAFLALLAFPAAGLSSAPEVPPPTAPLIAGRALLPPAASAPNPPVRIDPHEGNGPLVIVFVSARCPCSISHEASLKSLANDFKEARFVAIHSNAAEDEKEAASHFAAAGFPFPVIQDEEAKLAKVFGALKTPHAFVYDKLGAIAYQGGLDDCNDAAQAKKHYLKDALAALRSGKKPDPDRARSLGCIIRH